MAGAKIGALHVSLGLDSAQFAMGLKNASRGLNKFGVQLTLGLETIAEGIGRVIGAMPGAIKAAVDHADALAKSAQKAGTTVEALSRLEYAAKLSDVSLESLTGGLQKLGKSMADAVATPTSTAATAFKALGIELTNTDGTLRNSDVVLGEIAGKFARLEDGSTKTALAMQMFGKSGAELIPLLNGGSAGLKAMADESDRLGITISTKTAKAAEKFNDTLTTIGQIMQGVVNKVMEAALPALQGLADKLASPEFAAAAQQLAVWVVEAMGSIVDAVTLATVKIAEFGGEIKKWASIAAMVASGNFGGIVNFDRNQQIEAVQSAMGSGFRGQGWAGRQPAEITVNGGNTGSPVDQLDLPAFTSKISKAQEAIDPFAARIKDMSGVLTQTADPFAQMQMDVTDLTTMFEHGRIGAEQFGTAITKTVAGAAGDLAGLAGSALDALGQIFEGNKALAVASAIVNGIESVTKTFATYGATPWGFAAAGVAGLTAAANVANILRTTESSKSMPSTAGAGGGAAADGAGQGQSIYFNIKGSGQVSTDDLVDQITKQIADGGHQGFIKVMRAA